MGSSRYETLQEIEALFSDCCVFTYESYESECLEYSPTPLTPEFIVALKWKDSLSKEDRDKVDLLIANSIPVG